MVFGLIQSANDLFKIHTATAWAPEIPTASRIAEVDVTRQNTALSVQRRDRILYMHVVDAIWESANELDWINSLPNQVARIEVETEFFAMAQCFQGALGSVDVERNLSWVNFQCELHSALAKNIEDRIESLGEQLEARVDHLVRYWRERIQQMPNARAGETVDHADTESLSRPGGLLQLFDRALVDTFRFAIAPNVVGQNQLVPLVNVVANRLAD